MFSELQISPSALASQILGVKWRAFDVPSSTNGTAPRSKSMRVKLTDSERKRVQDMIKNARTMQEISRIEKDINEGRIPAGAADADQMQS